MLRKKSQLSSPKQHLIELMQHINYGRIEGIVIRNGEPIIKPLPRIVRQVKFGAENGPRSDTYKRDFTLKVQVLDLITQIEALGNGIIYSLEVKNGLPFKMNVEENSDSKQE